MSEKQKREVARECATELVRADAPRKKGGIGRARTIILLVVFLSVVVGLLLRAGWGTLSSMGIDAVAYLCPLGALETLLASHTMIPRTAIALVCALIVMALLGRAFCAWVCPVPPLRYLLRPNADKKTRPESRHEPEDAGDTGAVTGLSEEEKAAIRIESSQLVEQKCPANEAGRETDRAKAQSVSASSFSCERCSGSCGLAPVGGKRDGLQIDSRHGVLLGALVSSAVCGFPVFCLVCPIGLTFALAIALYRTFFEQNPTISLLVFAVILLVEVVFFRKWCHKICPVGALMSLVGAKAPLAKPHVDEGVCLRGKGIDCHACVDACPELLDPHSKSIPECTRCGKCVDACPASAISMRKAGRKSSLSSGKKLVSTSASVGVSRDS